MHLCWCLQVFLFLFARNDLCNSAPMLENLGGRAHECALWTSSIRRLQCINGFCLECHWMINRRQDGRSHQYLANHIGDENMNRTLALAITEVPSFTLRSSSMHAGDGTQDHLDDEVPPPKEIPLEDGQYEVGRGEDATLRIALPTVSSKHAILRIGNFCSCFCGREGGRC